MRPTLVLLLMLTLWTGSRRAGAEPPAPPNAIVTAAEKARALIAAGDEEGLHALASRKEPDPWAVAHHLLEEGRDEVAARFAAATSGRGQAALPAYVARVQARGRDDAGRDAWIAAHEALTRGEPETAVRVVAALEGKPDTVWRVWCLLRLAEAHRQAGRPRDALAAKVSAAAAARSFGWLEQAYAGLRDAAVEEVSAGRHEQIVGIWSAAMEVAAELEDPELIAATHLNRGMGLWNLSRDDEAVEAMGKAIALAKQHGLRRLEGFASLKLGGLHEKAGRLDVARALFEAASAILAEEGDPAAAVEADHALGRSDQAAGRHPASLTHYDRALARAREAGRKDLYAQGLTRRAKVLGMLGRHAEAHAAHNQALTLARELGDVEIELEILLNLGALFDRIGDIGRAMAVCERAREVALARGKRDYSHLRYLILAETVLERTMSLERAQATAEEALELARELAVPNAMAVVLGDLGEIQRRRGFAREGMENQQRALEIHRRAGYAAGVAGSLLCVGNCHGALCDYPRALGFHRRALQIYEQIGDRKQVAATLGNMANLEASMGRYAESLRLAEQALATSRELGNPDLEATALHGMAETYIQLGQLDRAIALHEEAVALFARAGTPYGEALAMAELGRVLSVDGRHADAEALYRKVMAREDRPSGPYFEAILRLNLGEALRKQGDNAGAIREGEQARQVLEQLGMRDPAALALGNVGLAHAAAGDRAKGLAMQEEAIQAFRRHRNADMLVWFLASVAELHLRMDDPERALLRAEQAVREFETMAGQLGEGESASLRGEHLRAFEAGALAAARLDRPGEMLAFLEGARAGALLESLGGRGVLDFEAIPVELREAEMQATAREAQARSAYTQAQQRNDREALKKANAGLKAARNDVQAAVERMQREAKRAAGLFYPRAATRGEIQEALPEDAALVLYGFCLDRLLALVLTPESVRIADLGAAEPVREACEALALNDDGEDPAQAVARLRALLVAPLKLEKGVRQVLVSPDGPLCYLPFPLLFEARPVTMTPSGTTHVLLQGDERESGRGVLALGDPDYAGSSEGARALYYKGRPLLRLEASKAEAEAIADDLLLGKDATEAALPKVLAKRGRWKAVHLACHGLVDRERPTLSALALTPGGEDDGFLTAQEVLRSKIPADLAVLSACETATGKVVRGEGILGLTRAFMYAGAPRVIASLWKVDDQATKALMVKFYDLWNPEQGEGLPAAEALRRAQAFVRGHEKWKHPYFWAAWVLWGLPA